MTTNSDLPEGAPLLAEDHPMLTVKEAAQKLGVSRSAIYRIDRQHGPFRIIKSNRRVFIDAQDLARYLTARDPAADPENDTPSEPMDTAPLTSEREQEIAVNSVPGNIHAKPAAPVGRGAAGNGAQRELPIPERRPLIVFYYW